MIVKAFYSLGTRDWDVELIREVFSDEESVRILKTTPGPQGTMDRQIWHYNLTCIYSVKMTYQLAIKLVVELQDPSQNQSFPLEVV